MFLDRDQIRELTDRQRRDAQVRMLRAMGVEHRVRADGSIAVLEAHVAKIFGAEQVPKRREQNAELDWS